MLGVRAGGTNLPIPHHMEAGTVFFFAFMINQDCIMATLADSSFHFCTFEAAELLSSPGMKSKNG
jgi:hypothetical protein